MTATPSEIQREPVDAGGQRRSAADRPRSRPLEVVGVALRGPGFRAPPRMHGGRVISGVRRRTEAAGRSIDHTQIAVEVDRRGRRTTWRPH